MREPIEQELEAPAATAALRMGLSPTPTTGWDYKESLDGFRWIIQDTFSILMSMIRGQSHIEKRPVHFLQGGVEGDEYSTVLQHHAEDLDREAKLYAPEIYRPRRTVELQILRREYVEYHFAYNAATAHRYNAFYFGDVSDSDDDPVEAEQGWQEALQAIHQRAQATRDTYRSRIHTAARLRTLATLLEPRTLPPPSPP